MFPPKNKQAVEKSRRSLPENVIVAVKAEEKVVSKEALAWALTHVVHPGDCVMLLAVISSAKSSQKFWRWRRLNGDCRKNDDCADLPDRICQISECCSRMVLQFQNQFEGSSTVGNGANQDPEKLLGHGVNHSTPVSSPEETSVFHPQVSNKNILSNSVASSVFLVYKQNPLFETLIKGKPSQINEPKNYDNLHTAMDSCGERIIALSLIPNSSSTIPQNNTVDDRSNIYQNSQFSYKKEKIFSSGIREAVSLGRALTLPPPLCSLCQYQAPALVADFGLVSLHSEHDACDEERVIGTSGYLAPEYFNGGIVTEKVDIYAFGLVLLELITGRRTSELQSYKTQKFWHDVYTSQETEPVHLLAYKHNLLDPRLGSYQPYNFPPDLHAIGHAASLCLQKDPESRPPMSKVLKVLEGETRNYLGVDMHSSGSRSGYMRNVILNAQIERRGHSRRLSY
ncbi:hypothetical protein L1987_44642 [Smallanthus sonchifolius]|uniref:Uncharacterized protein n=1 Tax=Smallanthus sonchifolius TaxID=185202 RepID=A0ACB9GR30_9ASTR|nr:hypothetical protein L1987_44642 [Smallanthus sonchifolius]